MQARNTEGNRWEETKLPRGTRSLKCNCSSPKCSFNLTQLYPTWVFSCSVRWQLPSSPTTWPTANGYPRNLIWKVSMKCTIQCHFMRNVTLILFIHFCFWEQFVDFLYIVYFYLLCFHTKSLFIWFSHSGRTTTLFVVFLIQRILRNDSDVCFTDNQGKHSAMKCWGSWP